MFHSKNVNNATQNNSVAVSWCRIYITYELSTSAGFVIKLSLQIQKKHPSCFPSFTKLLQSSENNNEDILIYIVYHSCRKMGSWKFCSQKYLPYPPWNASHGLKSFYEKISRYESTFSSFKRLHPNFFVGSSGWIRL